MLGCSLKVVDDKVILPVFPTSPKPTITLHLMRISSLFSPNYRLSDYQIFSSTFYLWRLVLTNLFSVIYI